MVLQKIEKWTNFNAYIRGDSIETLNTYIDDNYELYMYSYSTNVNSNPQYCIVLNNNIISCNVDGYWSNHNIFNTVMTTLTVLNIPVMRPVMEPAMASR